MRPSNTAEISYWITPVAGDNSYWLKPLRADDMWTAEKVIETYVGQERIYAFSDRSPGKTQMKLGDWICFYASGKGVVAHAKVVSAPEKRSDSPIRNPETYPWVFDLTDISLYFDSPVMIDDSLRRRLNAFKGKDLKKRWAWFVQATNKITMHDFDILTGR